MKLFYAFLFSLISFVSVGQNFTISGSIKDATNGEDVYGAIVMVKELTNVGTSTNTYGFYSLTLDQGEYTIVYRSTGFETQEFKITLNKDITKNLELKIPADVLEIQETLVRMCEKIEKLENK